MKILFLISFIFTSPIVLSQDCETSFKKILPYEEAKLLFEQLEIHSLKEYQSISQEKRKELRLPKHPDLYYRKKGQWRGVQEFFGDKLLSYEEARDLVQELGIRTLEQYQSMDKIKRREWRLPYKPREYYASKGWRGADDFFNKHYLTYEEAKLVLKKYKVKNEEDYNSLGGKKRKELRLPSHFRQYYKKTGEWRGAIDFFGEKLLSHKQARRKVRELGIRTLEQYQSMDNKKRKSLGLPARPREYYASKGWQGVDDFFNKHYLTYEEAKLVLKKYKVKNEEDYNSLGGKKRKELRLPSQFRQYYKKTGEWRGAKDFFEKKPKAKVKKSTKPTLTKQKNINEALKVTILSYKKASQKVRELRIQSFKEYRDIDPRQKKRLGLPEDPHIYYASKGWEGADDFFGYYIGDEL